MPKTESPERHELIRCRTPRCGTVLGVQVALERVRRIVPLEQGPNGHFAALYPVCGRRRVWTLTSTSAPR